jgi:hypothetical protein
MLKSLELRGRTKRDRSSPGPGLAGHLCPGSTTQLEQAVHPWIHRHRFCYFSSDLNRSGGRDCQSSDVRTKYAYNRYKLPFGICAGVIILSVIANAVTWWLIAESEREVRRVRKLAIKAYREGKRHPEA